MPYRMTGKTGVRESVKIAGGVMGFGRQELETSTTLSITGICEASSHDWDETWRKCDYATYFHSREWANIWNLYTNGKMKPCPSLIIFSDSRRALIPFAILNTYRGLIRTHISSPATTFGGWISNDALTDQHAGLMTTYLTERVENLIWRLNRYDGLTKSLLQYGLKDRQEDETQVLSLKNGFEAIHEQWTKGGASTARKTRKAIKEGVTVRLASVRDDWHAYYHVYEDSLRRWAEKASQKYSIELFDTIFNCRSPFVKLWLAVYQDTVIAGALCFYANRHAVYWHGAALEQFFALRPMNLLMHEIIRNSCDEGYDWFDFNPSGGHEGVKTFKKSFGATDLSCPIVVKESTLAKTLKAARRLLR